jgi:hypothetical protein
MSLLLFSVIKIEEVRLVAVDIVDIIFAISSPLV